MEQAEDEIAAVVMAIGAPAGLRHDAYLRWQVSPSWEAVSMAGMNETPVVIIDAQRPGLPLASTHAAQEDSIGDPFGHGDSPDCSGARNP